MNSIETQVKIENAKLAREVKNKLKQNTLLLNSPRSEFQELKEKLGWNSQVTEAEQEMGNIIQTKNYIESSGKNIILKDNLAHILIHNNYVLTPLHSYKGKITEGFLRILKDYFDSTKLQVGSIFNQEKILIAHPYKQGNYNENAKRSEELIVFEDITDASINDKKGYKMLGKTGTPNIIMNKLKACLFTHTRQQNAARNASWFLLGFLVVTAIAKGLFYFDEDVTGKTIPSFLIYNFFFIKFAAIACITVLLFKFFFIPICYINEPDSFSFNLFNDKNYRHFDSSSDTITKKFSYPDNKTLNIIKNYNRAGKLLILAVFFFVYYLINILPLSIYLKYNEVALTHYTPSHNEIYKPKSYFNFEYEITTPNNK